MIQRIQTIYLFVAAVAALLLLFLPVGIVKPSGEIPADPIVATEYMSLMIIAFVMVSLALLAIFFYSNRPFQIKMSWLGLMAGLGFAATFVVLHNSDFDNMRFTAGSGMPLLFLLMIILAARAINKDEKLIKSADRFR